MKAKLPDGRVIDIIRKHRPRCCDKCGASYRRRAMIEAWAHQNPGKSWGWVKIIIRLGVECCAGPYFSKNLLKMATVQIGWNGPNDLLRPPLEMERVKVGVKAGIFQISEKHNRGRLLLEAPKPAVKKGPIANGKS